MASQYAASDGSYEGCNWLIGMIDCYRALPVGADVDGRRLDRCGQSGGDGQDERHGTLPRAPGLQGATCRLAMGGDGRLMSR
jgi:hypothetical protein